MIGLFATTCPFPISGISPSETGEFCFRFRVLLFYATHDVYYALGDAIVVGIAGSQTSKTPIDLTFTLDDGTDCTFRFAMENTIRISGQNYILEANGRLWNLLSEASAETESETAETESEIAETESEAAETESEALKETESEHPAQIKN